MPKLEIFPDDGFFEIDGIPRQRGKYYITGDGTKIGLDSEIQRNLVTPVPFSEWTDLNDNPYTSYQALLNDLKSGFFLTKSEPIPDELTDFFENQLTVYTLYEIQPNGTTSGSLAVQAGITFVQDSFGGADLDIEEVGSSSYPTSNSVKDSQDNFVVAAFNPPDTPPNWVLGNPDTNGQDYALIFKVRGTRKDLTTYLDNNLSYFQYDDRGDESTGGGEAEITLATFLANTNEFLNTPVNRAAGWIDISYIQAFTDSEYFELQPDGVSILSKQAIIPKISVAQIARRFNASNSRSTPEIRIVYSIDGGVNFISVLETELGGYIRNSNPNIERASPVIPSYPLNQEANEDVIIKIQFRIQSESAAPQDIASFGYVTLTADTNRGNIIPVAPAITNPLPSPLSISSSQLFSHDLGILNATNVQVNNAPPNTTVSNEGILTILSPVDGTFPNFEVVASNNAPNSSINSSDLTISGFQNTQKWRFNGIDQYAITNSQNDLNLRHNDEGSIAFWVNINNPSQTNPIFHKRTIVNGSPQLGYLVQITSNGEIFLKLQNSNSNILQIRSSPSSSLIDGNRHFVVITKTNQRFATGVEMYIDGALVPKVVDNDTLLNSSTTNSEPLYNGINLFDGSTANIDCDEIAIWRNKTLSSTEVATFYNSGIPFNYNTLANGLPQNWWRAESAILGVIGNQRSTSTQRVLNLVNFDNNIVPF